MMTGRPPVPAQRRSWWRDNRLALGALVVLIPVVGGGIWYNEWHYAYGYGARPVNAVPVAAEQTIDLEGATWGPIRTGEISKLEGLDMPADTRLLVAIIPVEPDSTAVGCQPPVLVQQSTGRSWTPMRSEVGLPFSAEEPDRCIADLADPDDPASAQPYSITVGFVVPDDVEGPFWVDVDPLGDATFVRFPVDF